MHEPQTIHEAVAAVPPEARGVIVFTDSHGHMGIAQFGAMTTMDVFALFGLMTGMVAEEYSHMNRKEMVKNPLVVQ